MSELKKKKWGKSNLNDAGDFYFIMGEVLRKFPVSSLEKLHIWNQV